MVWISLMEWFIVWNKFPLEIKRSGSMYSPKLNVRNYCLTKMEHVGFLIGVNKHIYVFIIVFYMHFLLNYPVSYFFSFLQLFYYFYNTSIWDIFIGVFYMHFYWTIKFLIHYFSNTLLNRAFPFSFFKRNLNGNIAF